MEWKELIEHIQGKAEDSSSISKMQENFLKKFQYL